MKTITLLFLIAFLCGCVHMRTETEQVKYDLIGQTTGGREKAWKFQSVDQIKKINIDKTIIDGKSKIQIVSMTLHDDRVRESYDATVKITYKCVDNSWKIKSVGLLYIKQE